MMLSTTVGAALDVSSSVRTQACWRRAAVVESMPDSFGLKPELARSNRACGQFAEVGVPAALAELPPNATGNVSSNGKAAISQRRLLSMPMSAIVYTGRAGMHVASGCTKSASHTVLSAALSR